MKLISVVIPAHNEEDVIEKCLNPFKSQKTKDVEIILVNDGSTDRTAEIAKKTDVCDRIINFKEGHSAAFARNRGAEKARGKWLVFIDADMIVEKTFLNKIKRFIENNEFDGSDYLVFSYKPKTIFQKAWSAYRKYDIEASPQYVHIIRKDVFKELGGFDENIFYFEDFDFRNRFFERGYVFKGPVNTKVYHIEPATWRDFLRQKKWQGRMAPIRYFLPCIFPPLLLIQFFRILRNSKELKNTLYWIGLDFIGRYISLGERIKRYMNGRVVKFSLKKISTYR
jgi:glycosyltransferase involved in cell wall biosynthesis